MITTTTELNYNKCNKTQKNNSTSYLAIHQSCHR